MSSRNPKRSGKGRVPHVPSTWCGSVQNTTYTFCPRNAGAVLTTAVLALSAVYGLDDVQARTNSNACRPKQEERVCVLRYGRISA